MAYITLATSRRARSSGALGALRRHGPRSLLHLGAPVIAANGNASQAFKPPRHHICPVWGCGAAPPVVSPAPSYPTAPNTFYPGTPVPVGTSTTAPYVDASGNLWTFNSNGGGWMNATLSSGYYGGTPVPAGTPTNTAYTDANGNIWVYSNGAWINTSAAGAAIPANAVPASVTVSTAPATNGYQSVLDWLSQAAALCSR